MRQVARGLYSNESCRLARGHRSGIGEVQRCQKEKIMPTVSSIMAELKKKGSEKTRKIYARHGMATDCMFGVSIADLKVIAKTIKGQQALACELYEMRNVDAMYLAGIVANGSQMTDKQLNAWAE